VTWLTPAIAGVAAAIAVPTLVLLYFLKLRRRSVEISTTLLWRKAIEDLQANAPFQKLRRNLLLFLQLLILGALLGAVGQPMLETTSGGVTRHIIMIDRSASMNATDGDDKGATRLEASRRRALEFVDAMRERGLFGTRDADEAMVIAFDTTAEVRQQFTDNKAALRSAIDAIEPTDAPTELEEAMRLSKAQAPKRIFMDDQGGQGEASPLEVEGLYAGPPSEVQLWTDGKIADAADVLPRSDDIVIFNVVGSPESRNVGITGLRAERAFDNPNEVSVFVGLESTATEDVTVDVELVIAGVAERVPLAKPVTIPAAEHGPAGEEGEGALRPGTAGVVFTLDHAEGALLAVNLTVPADVADVLEPDNRGRLVLPPAKKLDVALVTTGDPYLQLALEGLPLNSLTLFTPDEYDQALSRGGGEFDVVVLDRYVPEGGLPPGRFVVFGAVPPPLALAKPEPGPPTVFITWDRDHPALRHLNLTPIAITESRPVVIPPDASAEVIAETDTGPGIIELITAQSHALVVPFEPLLTTWPFDTSFPLFVATSVVYVGGSGSESAQSLTPGEILSDRLPVDAKDVELRTPDDEESRLVPTPDGRVAFGPLRRAGVYRMSWKGSATARDGHDGSRAVRLFAANLLDPAESDVTPADAITLKSRTVAASRAGETKINQRLWPWLILAALAIVMLEWWIYNRKVYV